MQTFSLDKNTKELLSQLVDPIVLLDQKASVLYFNAAFSRLSGYPEDKVEQEINLFIEESFIPKKDRLLQEVLKTGTLQGIEANLKTANGQLIPLLVSANRLDQMGNTLIILQIKDISEKQKSIQQLTESEARFKVAFDNAFDPVLIIEITHDKKPLIRFANKAACVQYGYSEEEFITLSIDRLDDESNRKEIPKRIKKLIAGEEIHFTTTHIRKDGSRFPCKVNTKIITIAEKKYIYAQHRDVSEQLAYEKALSESEAKYHFLADNTYDWEYWVSPEGKFEYISPACQRITGYSQKEFINNPARVLDIVHPDDVKSVIEHYKKEVHTPHKAFSAEFKMIRADGQTRWIQHHCFPIYDKNGKYIGRRGVNRDITERKEAELEAATAKRKIEQYMNSAPILFFVLDRLGNILFANQKVEQVLGFSPKTILGDNIFNRLLPQQQRKTSKRLYAGFMKGKTDGLEHFEQQVLNADGQWQWLNFTNALLWNETKQEMETIVAAEDVTGKKKNLDMLRMLNLAVMDASEVIFMTDKKGNFTFVNPEFTRYYGYTKEEVVGKVTPRIIKSEHTPQSIHIQTWKDLLNKKPVKVSYQNKTKEGQLVDVASNMYPILDKKDEIIGFLCIQRDISDRLRYEKLQEIMVQIANAAYTSKDLQALFDFIKKELAKVLKSDHLMIAFYDEQKGKLSLPFVNKFESKEEITEADVKNTFSEQVILSGKPRLFRSHELKQMIRSGKVRVVGTLSKVWLGVPLRVENKITGLLVLQDYEAEDTFNESDLNILDFVSKQISISIERLKIRTALKQKEKELLAQNKEYYALYEEYKSQNEELIRAKEKAEESDQLKSEFLLNLNHEIRTPLNAITGFSSLMIESDLSKEEQDNYAQIIFFSSEHLLKIIKEILEISQLKAHEIKIDKKAFQLNRLMMELFDEYNHLAKEKGIPLYLTKALNDSESECISDKKSIKIIFQRLLDNAFKFTTSGQVEMGYSVEGDQLILFVKDTGIGIHPENQEIIFKSFSQEEKKLTEKVGGLGLGLSIAQEYAHLLNSTISLESEKGKGSSFYFKIPFHEANRPMNEKEKKKAKASTKKHNPEPLVLVVEDEVVNFQYLEALLKLFKKNIRLHHVCSGEEAVSFCKKHPELHLVLMDLRLPKMNGFDATGLIKKLRPDLPVIAQTAYTQKSDREKALQAGCDGFISKPINKKEFHSMVGQYLRGCNEIN